MTIAFYIAGIIAIAATLMVITRSNAIHALLYLIVSLFAIAITFFVMGAPFVAALEIIIYAGAIMVLFVFVIMLLNLGKKSADQERKWLTPGIWIGPGIMAAILLVELIIVFASGTTHSMNIGTVSPKEVGISMFSTYLLGVELASMLLLAGLVGAYHLGRRLTEPKMKN